MPVPKKNNRPQPPDSCVSDTSARLQEFTPEGADKYDRKFLIDPGYAVKVELNASGTLKNQADNTKTIAYTVNDTNGDAFTVGTYTTAGDKTDLTIDITQEAWNAAFAGQYSDTVTFTVSYINTVNP